MVDQPRQRRLSQLTTLWTQVLRAHLPADHDGPGKARRLLMERYQIAVFRYLLGAVKNEEVAEELFQEFAVRFLRGAFHRADPSRGRFRDFVKKSLINLVNDHRKREGKRRHQSLRDVELEPGPAPDPHRQFVDSWRQELFAHAWEALAEAERTGKQPFHTVLSLRARKQRLSSTELAEQVTARLQLDKPLTDVTTRKLLQRAREKLGELLLAEVAHSLGGEGTLAEVEEELVELGLIDYCRSALDRRRRQ